MRISDWSSDVCSSDLEDEQVALLGDGQRVDFDLRGVGRQEGLIERGCDLGGLLRLIAGQFQRGGDGAAMVRHEAGGRLDGEGMDLLTVGRASCRERVFQYG